MEKRLELALFDFDGTLIPGDSIVAFMIFLRKKGVMSAADSFSAFAAAVSYALGRMSEAESKSRAMRGLNRLAEDEKEKLAREFVSSVLLPRVYPKAKECLKWHREAGRKLLLVTASTENYMSFVSEALGFDALLATPMNPDGTVGANCKGEEKARRISRWLREQGARADFSASWAYGDSMSDLPMLRLCGHGVLVNPKGALIRAAGGLPRETWR